MYIFELVKLANGKQQNGNSSIAKINTSTREKGEKNKYPSKVCETGSGQRPRGGGVEKASVSFHGCISSTRFHGSHAVLQAESTEPQSVSLPLGSVGHDTVLQGEPTEPLRGGFRPLTTERLNCRGSPCGVLGFLCQDSSAWQCSFSS